MMELLYGDRNVGSELPISKVFQKHRMLTELTQELLRLEPHRTDSGSGNRRDQPAKEAISEGGNERHSAGGGENANRRELLL